jgi:hypothetical protein
MSCDERSGRLHGLGNTDVLGRLLLEKRCVEYVDTVDVRKVLLLLCTLGLEGSLWLRCGKTHRFRVG